MREEEERKKERKQSSSGVRRQIDRGGFFPLPAVAAGSTTGNKPITHIRSAPVTVQMASPRRAAGGAMKKDEQSKQQRLKGAQELCLLTGRVVK